MNAEPIHGGCLCGAVRFRVDGLPFSVSICHCRSCRLASGAPAVSWFVVSMNQFAWLSVQPAVFLSSPEVTRSFCGQCGTQLAYMHDDAPRTIELTTASLDNPSVFKPTKEIWLSEKLSWVATNPSLDHYSRDSQTGSPDVA